MRPKQILLPIFFLGILFHLHAQSFVQKKGKQFYLGGKPYYYVGTNYWYGSLLTLQKDPQRGVERLKKELDFLKSKGVKNLRVLAGAEGIGLVNGVMRVGPPLQKEKGVFNDSVLNSLDVLLAEMNKRNMKAILILSNNWEWSGGFLQYLRWNGLIEDSVFRRKLDWEEWKNYVSKFYGCDECRKDYLKQVDHILNHKSKITGKKYINDPAIMAWELANEPRPMLPSANEAYSKWIRDVAAHIKSKDRNHLVTLGHEGEIGTQSMELYEAIHKDKNVDYLTIHIWPKNWQWFSDTAMAKGFTAVITNTTDYINKHIAEANKLNKPLVIEEFGFPRDQFSFEPNTNTFFRDQYYSLVFNQWKKSVQSKGPIAGLNFWAFGGSARPIRGQLFWKDGDEYMGDPPMEEQGLNTVFDNDDTTWKLIYSFSKILVSSVKKK